MRGQRTCEPQRRGTALDKVVAEIDARQHFLVRTRNHLGIDDPVPGLVGGHAVLVFVAEFGGGAVGTIEEGVGEGAGLEVGLLGGEIVATGDGDGAEPLAVGVGAVVAGYGEGVLGGGGGVAGDLLEGVVEVHVGFLGEVVVDGGEVRVVWVGWDGVGDLVAEGEVVNDFTVVIWRTED